MLLLCEWAVLFCLRLLTVPETWLIVRRWCITRFFSLLIGGLWKSPNWISPQFTSQDETGPSRMPPLTLFELVCEIERERTGVQREWKSDPCPSFLFLPDMHFISRLQEEEGAGHSRAELLFQDLLGEVLEFHIRKLCHRVCADYPKYDSVLFGQEIR